MITTHTLLTYISMLRVKAALHWCNEHHIVKHRCLLLDKVKENNISLLEFPQECQKTYADFFTWSHKNEHKSLFILASVILKNKKSTIILKVLHSVLTKSPLFSRIYLEKRNFCVWLS